MHALSLELHLLLRGVDLQPSSSPCLASHERQIVLVSCESSSPLVLSPHPFFEGAATAMAYVMKRAWVMALGAYFTNA